MYVSSLRIPDSDSWHNDPGYSRAVADALKAAYRPSAAGRALPPVFERAWATVFPVCHLPMSKQQRMHIRYLHAAAYTESWDYELALSELDDTESLANELREGGARADVLYLRSIANLGLSRIYAAVENCEAYLALVRDLDGDDPPTDPALMMEVCARLASFQVIAADFPGALHSVGDAEYVKDTFMARGAIPKSALGNMLLVRAHIARLGNARFASVPDALNYAMAAAEIYHLDHSIPSLIRARTLAADIALDLAEAYGHNRAADAFKSWITLAEPYVEKARALALVTGDEAGYGLALLSQARLHLLTGANVDTNAPIQHVLRLARDLDDPGLYVQALTALAHDLMGRGETQPALGVYRTVITRVRATEVPMLGIIPRNALLRAYHD